MNIPRIDLRELKAQVLSGKLDTVLTRYGDIALAVLVVAILGIMIVPLPTLLLDFFLASNLTLAITILMVSLYVPHALSLAAFPSILLVTTLFRLALNVATTRLILSKAYAGEVVASFGGFVVQGNFVVGFVIFLIITIIQFVVIAKGAERIAEVSARFTLDALPGKQMSIDADLRSGILDTEGARRARANLGRESQFYGAMDGAMKFVKGDAIAGILISIINIIAGLGIGVVAKGMSWGEAARTYTQLTVGDGLVAQIPALIIALSAGMITTRVASAPGEESSLGREIGLQILRQPKAILIAAGTLLALGLVPGMPHLAFIVLAAITGATGWIMMRTQRKKSLEELRAEIMGEAELEGGSDRPRLPMAVPVILEVSSPLTRLVDVERPGTRFIQELIPQIRDWLFSELGVNFPGVRVHGDVATLADNGYRYLLHEVPVGSGIVEPERLFVSGHLDELAEAGVEGTSAPHPGERGREGMWVERSEVERLKLPESAVIQPDEYLAVHLATLVKERVDRLLGVQDVQNILDLMETRGYGALVRSVVPSLVTPPRLTDILRRLLQEGISIRDMRTILEALATAAPFENDPVYLTESVRAALRDYIGHHFSGGSDQLSVYLLDPHIEQSVREGVRQSASGATLSLEPEVSRNLMKAFSRSLGEDGQRVAAAVILTQRDVRPFLFSLLRHDFPGMAVLSFQELRPNQSIRPIGRITFGTGELGTGEIGGVTHA
ncbi:MAG: type III secretion system export apparatus subunit SctV [Thermoanaerobaculia bacterium]